MFDQDSPRKCSLNARTLFGSICSRGSDRRSWGIEANVQRIDAKATLARRRMTQAPGRLLESVGRRPQWVWGTQGK